VAQGLNGNRAFAGLLITVNVALCSILAAWVNARFDRLQEAQDRLGERIGDINAHVSGLHSELSVRVSKANEDHATYNRAIESHAQRLVRLERRLP